jgi:hypothetical protein
MALYQKSDMFYKDYTWTASPGDNPHVTGKPDRDKLSKKEGYEVLDFINNFLTTYSLKQKSSGEKIERMLRHKDISSTHSREKIQEWIVKNWKSID